MTTKGYGLYIHIPFCIEKCAYCDFCSYGGRTEADMDAYVTRLCEEITTYKRDNAIPIDTIYFGGGTPSLITKEQLERIVLTVRQVFLVSDDPEVTLEMNPGTVTEDKLRAYKALGINRVSLGIQSIHEKELKKLGRIHSYEDAVKAYRMLRALGYDNISVDLMYGIPYETENSLSETLDEILALAPDHISAYGLIVEEGTPFYLERDSLPLPTDDEECDMYYLIADRLSCHGYSHYEISNYARPGKESRHNLKYWRDEEYIGVGVAAYSYFDGVRYGNTRSLTDYMSGIGVQDRVEIDPDSEAYEYAMMRLRLKEGISLADYEHRFGRSFLIGRESELKTYADLGLLTLGSDRISFTERGFYVSNTLLANIL